MRLRPFVRPIVVVLLVLGVGAVAYATRESWLPHVFPSRAEKTDAPKPDDHEHATDQIKLSQQAQQNLGLEADTLTPREYWRRILIPGVVADRPGESDRGVTSRVTGVVTRSGKPGDTVSPAPLSNSTSRASSCRRRSNSRVATDLPFAVVEPTRRQLVELGTAAASDLTKLQNQVDRLTSLIKSLRRQLLLWVHTGTGDACRGRRHRDRGGDRRPACRRGGHAL